ncbi:hypothetical protein [Acidovorax sp. SUPP2539]|uniref:hypothetical protein n=1 Tax=Acidovorax sp. SUPP2539 TaxID=2920878 RepID=UPI0023DE6802|nr:hypothetical protein [Acidovorax sp. SUPP2539]GKS91207.1 hypothetical protein AVTE2539_17600 [Acidovorax sp. SUPP2539]
MKKRRQPAYTRHYTLLHEISASPIQPLPKEWQRTQLTSMWDGLRDMEQQPNPDTSAWRVCSDAVNLMETLVAQGEVEDGQGLLMDAITALAEAGKRHRAGHPLRLSGPGMRAVRAVLEDYAEVIAVLPARTMIRCHRLTEKRLHEILAGRRLPHDVEVIAA